jgi:hypothetical protein
VTLYLGQLTVLICGGAAVVDGAGVAACASGAGHGGDLGTLYAGLGTLYACPGSIQRV